MRQAKVYALTMGDPGFYLVSKIPCEIGGTGFLMQRVGDRERAYQVRVDEDPRNCDCTCKGFLRHGSCKHILLGLEILSESAKDMEVMNVEEANQV